jgi:DNA-binding NarL/FixJ family response regulator
MGAGVRIMVIEDHPLFRDALVARAEGVLGTVDVAYSGASIDEALSAHATEPTTVALLDLDLGNGRSPILNTVDLVEAGCRVLIVSAIADPATVRAVLRAGALGFVSKASDGDEFQDALRATMRGEPSTSRDVAAILSSDDDTSVRFTERERTALVLYASGMKIDAVARRMGIKPATAQEYIKRVREKYMRAGTPAPTKTALYQRARDGGLVL